MTKPNRHPLRTRFLAAALLLLAAPSVLAAPITFLFDWSGQPFGNLAEAHGHITFEGTLLPNPGSTTWVLPNPAILDLSITVSGSTGGNGTFGLADFGSVFWSIGGVALDLTTELVGQSTAGNPWGTDNVDSGEFNLIAGVVGAPGALYYFTLGTNRDGPSADDSLLLVSFRPAPVPVPSVLLLLGAGLVGLAFRHGGRGA